MAETANRPGTGPPPSVLDRLKAITGPDGWIDDPREMAAFVTDQRGNYRGTTPLVLRPSTKQQVSEIVTVCAETGTALVPQGGNTGLCGGAIPHDTGREIVVSLARLNRILDIDSGNNTITVEAGCILADIQRAADEAGRLFPLSLGAEGNCQIGGNLSTNAGGTAVLRYGNARDLVLGLEVVLGDGRIWDGLRALRKDNTGYDLKQLFIGAEGTLGIITAAVLKLYPKPAETKTALTGLASVENAVALFSNLRAATGDRLTALEIFSRTALDLVHEQVPEQAGPFDGRHDWYVLLDVSAAPAEQGEPIAALVEDALHAAMESGLISDAVIASSEAQARALWDLRDSIPAAQNQDGGGIKHDVSIPITSFADFIAEASAAVERELPGTRVIPFGHLGDGNVHFNLCRPRGMAVDEFLGHWEAMNRAVHDIVHRLGGSVSAEHGLGQLKRAEARHYKSAVEIELMETLKAAFDPQGILNPGKVL